MNYSRIYDALIARAVELRGHPLSIAKRHRRKGFEIHHIKPVCMWPDDPARDASENLVWLTFREHRLAHWLLAVIHGGILSRAFWLMCNRGEGRMSSRSYEKHRELGNLALREWYANPENAARHIERMEQWANHPEERAKMEAIYASPEWRTAVAEASAERWANPEEVERAADAMRNRNADPEYQVRCRAGMTPEKEDARGKAISRGQKARFEDPQVRAAHSMAMRKRSDSEKWKASHRALTESQKKAVIGFEIGGSGVMFFPGLPEARAAGLQGANISACCRGVRLKAHGYTWRFATAEEIRQHTDSN